MNIQSAINSEAVKAAFSIGNYAYIRIPTDCLRDFFDSLFPVLAKNTNADIASGFMHRWTAGHDLLIDIPKTVMNQGVSEGVKQTGHILLTDFPTKAGIPIPGLSSSGLGNFLVETCKIPKGYLCLNIMDTAVGIFAMTEGTFDIFNVISGQLRMSPQLFLDTFIEGTAEIVGGVYCENPLLLIAGAENLAAGLISTFHTITKPLWYISPVDFFSSCLSGGLLTLILSKFVLRKNSKDAIKDAIKSCVISGLFSASISFGIGGIAAMLCCGLGKLMAEKDNKELAGCFSINEDELIMLQINTKFLLKDINRNWFFCERFDKYNNIPSLTGLKTISFCELLGGQKKFSRIPILLGENNFESHLQLLMKDIHNCQQKKSNFL